MIPPSTWLVAPSGLITRPMSWIAAMRSTVTSPVSTSPAPSGTGPPNATTALPARLDVDGYLGDVHAERQHVHAGRVRTACAGAEDLAVAEQLEHLSDRPA